MEFIAIAIVIETVSVLVFSTIALGALVGYLLHVYNQNNR